MRSLNSQNLKDDQRMAALLLTQTVGSRGDTQKQPQHTERVRIAFVCGSVGWCVVWILIFLRLPVKQVFEQRENIHQNYAMC